MFKKHSGLNNCEMEEDWSFQSTGQTEEPERKGLREGADQESNRT